MASIMNQQPSSSSRQARAEEPVNVDPFLIQLNRVNHSADVVKVKILKKKAEIKKHKKKLLDIEHRLKKLYKQKRTAEGELYLAQMDFNVLQEGLENGSDSE